MKKIISVVFLIIVILVVAFLILHKKPAEHAGVALSPQNASYTIEGKPVQLTNGISEVESEPGSASKVVTRYFGNETKGDLNADGMSDTAFIMTQEGNGSGTFYYVATALGAEGGYMGTNAVFLGDRIAPQTTEIKNGLLVVNYADRAANEPMTAQPSVAVSKYFKIDAGQLVTAPKPPVDISSWPEYTNSTTVFSIKLPSFATSTTAAASSSYLVDTKYKYQLTPKKTVAGVKFTIPPALKMGTNLSSDTYISVESIVNIPAGQSCSTALFLDGTQASSTITDGGVTYTVATSSNAGAGNRYEETVYVIPSSKPCIAIRYFVHYSAIENYDPGTIHEFNKADLLEQFDTIRKSLMLP